MGNTIQLFKNKFMDHKPKNKKKKKKKKKRKKKRRKRKKRKKKEKKKRRKRKRKRKKILKQTYLFEQYTRPTRFKILQIYSFIYQFLLQTINQFIHLQQNMKKREYTSKNQFLM